MFINIFIIIPLLLFYIFFRFSIQKEIIIVSKIRYQVVDFGQNDFIRSIIESNLNNRRIFLADENSVNNIY